MIGLDLDYSVFGILRFEVIFTNNSFRYVFDTDTNLFRAQKVCREIEIGNFHRHEPRIFAGNDTVQQKFGNQHFCSWSCHLSWIVNTFSSDNKTRAIIFGFFRSHQAQKMIICDIFHSSSLDIFHEDELDRVGSFDLATYVILKSSKFSGGRNLPILLVSGMPH